MAEISDHVRGIIEAQATLHGFVAAIDRDTSVHSWRVRILAPGRPVPYVSFVLYVSPREVGIRHARPSGLPMFSHTTWSRGGERLEQFLDAVFERATWEHRSYKIGEQR